MLSRVREQQVKTILLFFHSSTDLLPIYDIFDLKGSLTREFYLLVQFRLEWFSSIKMFIKIIKKIINIILKPYFALNLSLPPLGQS